MMPPCTVGRPAGTDDYLLMVFHDPASAGAVSAPQPLLPAETMMIWAPRQPQYYGNPSQRFCHTWIHCSGKRVRQMLRSVGLPFLTPIPLPDPSRFQQCLLDMHGESISYSAPNPVILGNLLENSLQEVARMQRREEVPISESLLAVRCLIGTVPKRPISLRELAASAGMSVPHFCARFKQAFGLPPMRYLLQHRMHHAAHLLSNKNLSISEIAAQVGYPDLFHFSKMFKRHFKVGPREMRRRGF